LFQTNNNVKSIHFLLCAETDGEPQLAMAFANRSAALFHLAEYTRALVDIDQALSNRYPVELRYKLAERQAKCLMALGKTADQVIEACESALLGLNDSRLDDAKRGLFERDIKLLMEESKSPNRMIPCENPPASQILPKRGNVQFHHQRGIFTHSFKRSPFKISVRIDYYS
jgi:hypothetical protein